jgi:hypothetical protein
LDSAAAEECLKTVYHEVEDRYYDASFHGIDLKARAKEAKDRITKVHTLSKVYDVIAWMLDGLNDSHTFFYPRFGLTTYSTDGNSASLETGATSLQSGQIRMPSSKGSNRAMNSCL